MKKILFSMLLVLGAISFASAQVLVEDFDYTAGTTLDSNGWAIHSTGGSNPNPIFVGSNSLTFPTYAPAANGGSAVSAGNGQDINSSFTAVSSGDVYASFLLRVDTIGSSSYFFHFMDASGSSAYRARTFFQVDANNSNAFNLGLTFNSSTGVFDTTEFLLGDTILVVAKYTIVSGTANDSVSLYAFDPSGSFATEPATPLLGPFVGTATDIDPARIALRQFNSNNDFTVDAFRVNTIWDMTMPLSQIDLPITWDEATVDYSTVGFGGSNGSVSTDPTNAANDVLQLIKGTGAQTWAGVTLSTTSGLTNTIPFTATANGITAKIYSPDTGLVVKLKAEVAGMGSLSVETDMTTTVANGWETIVFDFTNNSASTPAINYANNYNMLSIFCDFGNVGTNDTFYVDSVYFAGATSSGPTLAQVDLPITWDDTANVDYSTTGFGGANATLALDPTNSSNNVLEMIKGTGAQTWGGVTLSTSSGLASAIPFSATANGVSVQIYSPDSGVTVRLKTEVAGSGSLSVETEAQTTVSNGWETLVFDFTNNVTSTPAINYANSYNMLSLFYDFGNVGANDTVYVDSVYFGGATSSGPTIAQIDLPISWDDTANVNYATVGFGGSNGTLALDPTNSSNNVLEIIKGTGAQTWAGVTLSTTNGLASTIPFSSNANNISVKVYSPASGLTVRLKTEVVGSSSVSVETDATTTVANGWETLVFDFTNNVTSTPAINYANSYNMLSVFFDFGNVGANDTFYVDSVYFGPFCTPFTVPYFEGFESGFADQSAVGGTCLTQESVTGTQVWTANNTLTTYNRSPRTGGWNSYLRYENEDWMFIPIDLVANTTYNFSAYARQDGSSASNSDVTVAYGTSASAAAMTNSIVATTGIVNGNYQEIAGGFTPTTSGVYYVGINGYMNNSPWYISLDDISITVAPANDAVAASITNALACGAGADSIAVGVTNNGTATITSLPISTSINGGTFSSAGTFTVNIPFGTTETVMIPVTAVSGNNDVIVALNLTGDVDNTNDTISASYFKGNVEVALTINTVGFGGEVYWALVDSASGFVIDTIAPNTYANNSTYNYTYCLDSNSTYTFNAYDDYGDSWNGGTYTFTTCSGVVVIANNGGVSPTDGAAGAGLESTEDFTIPGSCPACLSPSTLSADSITNSSASLSWTENGTATSWVIEYDTTGFTQGSGNILAAGTNPFTLTGLTSNTTYQYYVQANCGADSSNWEGPFAFTTLCDPFTAPYTENFDGLALTSPYTALPSCWGTQSGPDYWDVTNDLVNNGHAYLPNIGDHTTGSANYMWIDASSDITANEMESPMIDMSALTSPYAGFWFASNNTANSTNHTIALDAWDGSAWVNVTTESGNFTGWVEVGDTLPSSIPSTTKFRIYAIADTGTTGSTYFQNDLGVDDFFVIEAPSCFTPSSLAASNITTTGATISWTENGSATSWQIEYDTAGFVQGTGTMTVVSSNPTSLSGLTFETNYDFYVRSICGVGDTSAWSGLGSFYTGYCNPNPSSVDGTGITNVSMDTLSNTTGAEPGNYGNYSSMIAVAAQGATFPIDITLATGYTYDMWAWVDWNDDLDFSDPGEDFFLGTSTNVNPTTFSSSIAIPATAALGNHRIRIGGADAGLGTTSPSNPCYTGAYASFEDYTLNIIALAQIDLTITWDEIGIVDYTTVAFEGGISSAALDPMNSSNNVLQFVKPVGAQPWAGVTLSTSAGLANPIPFTASATTVSAQVYSPAAGTTIMMKTEVVGTPTIFVEATATTTTANGWETLVFDFGAPSNGSLNLTNTYGLLSFFPDFLTAAAGDTFYVDSVYFGGVVPTKDAAVTAFEGLSDTTCLTTDTLMIVLENFGNTAISNFDIIGNQNGGANDTLFYADTIAANGVDTLYFPVDLDPGNNTFNVWTIVVGDVDVTNDSNNTSIFSSIFYTSASSVDVTCPESIDGLAAVTVDSGGVAPFTYMWSDANMTMTNTISGLGVGNYYVTSTDASGCEFVDSISINALNASPSVSISGKDTICGSETSTLDAGGGFNAYAWDGGATTQTITVNTTGTYMVTITDANGCVNDDSYDIFAYATITLSTSKVDVTCEGGNDGVATGTATGGAAGFTYEWNDGSTNSSNIGVEEGDYIVTATDAAGCLAIDTVEVGFLYANPAFSFAQASVAGEQSVTVNAGGAFDNYVWSNGESTATVTFTNSGTYSLTVSDTNGCTTSDTISVEIWPLGVNQVEATSMSVYPNPSTGLFNLSLNNVPADQIEIIVMNLNGQVITTTSAKASNGVVTDVVDLSNQAAGVYLLQVNINGTVSTLRLNVQ
jgi:hypothetical protein